MVNHKILQEKLEHHGIRGIALDWCRDYLTNRKQILKYKSDNSDSLTIKCGYHRDQCQDHCFSLFISMTMNYESSRISSFILFADNTNLFHSHCDKNLNNLLNTIDRIRN